MSWQAEYIERFYSPAKGWVNGTREFHELCASVIPRGSKILEIGPGPGNHTSRLLATLGEVHGIDPDPVIKTNESLASAAVLEGDRFPYPDGSFDACASDYCLEHVPDTAAHVAEVARVLRPGGVYVFRTPNLWHYVTLISKLTPHWFHELVANRLRNIKGGHDPYPTVYAMNTEADVRRLAAGAGLRVEELRLIEKEPSYGMSSRTLFLLFMAYERAVNSTPRAAMLRSTILAVLRKDR